MKSFFYLKNVSTLTLDIKKCTGCKICLEVCPHGVLGMTEKKATIIDLNGCMECGACVLNCKDNAIQVTPGVGCASYILSSWIKGKENASCGCDCC